MNTPCIRPDWPAPANVIALTTLRRGGESLPPFSSFNLAAHVGDDDAAVQANRVKLARLLPAGSRVQWLTQVHGTDVANAAAACEGVVADASWSRSPGCACAVLTADCLPVLFCSRAGDAVAAAHAGWRGLLGGVLEHTVLAMGLEPGQIMAWLGPAIGPAAFEVGPEVRAAFLGAAPPRQQANTDACFVASAARPDHYLADLYALARLRLADLGLGGVFGGGFCTFSDDDRFFSYRRDGRTGRMASLILLR
ncbi:MAG: peptidoglycan editing factor PgeF [Halieaceae bacterium]|jgi:YfiH family protein|nr:peptidoglycan editing factor PgeF [Halieaceae bacterium]